MGYNEQCNTLRPKCNEYTPAETCDGQCEQCNRALTFSLEWSDINTDMDLRVNEPDGTEIRFNNRDGVSGYARGSVAHEKRSGRLFSVNLVCVLL